MFIYGSPDRQKRKKLWESLTSSIPIENIPWMAIGDFDALLYSNDKKGGRRIRNDCPLFNDFLEKSHL